MRTNQDGGLRGYTNQDGGLRGYRGYKESRRIAPALSDIGYFGVPLGDGGMGPLEPDSVEPGSGSTFDPVPGVAPLGDGAKGRLSVPELDPTEPGNGATFDPVPGLAPDGGGEPVDGPDAPPPSRLPCVADGALFPVSSTGVTANTTAGAASEMMMAAVATYGVRRMDMMSLP
jgi:hypothetical protein